MVAAIAPSSVKAGTPRNRTHLSHIRKEQIKKTKVKEDRGFPRSPSYFLSFLSKKSWFFVKFWGAKVSMHSWRGHALNTVRVLFRCVC